MHYILQSKYYNIGKEKVGKYLVQMRSKAKSGGLNLPEVHGIGKGLDLNILPEKQLIKPIITSEAKSIYQSKPSLGQGRAGLKLKIKIPMSPLINKPIVKLTENPILHIQDMVQPKITSKVPIPEKSSIHDKAIPIPDYAIPQTRSRDDSGSRMVKRKTIQDISREILMYPDLIYRPTPKPTEIPLQEIPRNLSDLYMDINTDFEENSPNQEVMISETYQKPDKSYFQEPQELDSLINTGKLVQKFLQDRLIYIKY